ncbi:efflux RND transporter periplasmic adaptor subunit [uncultured Methylibium sp.]|uniref:efflux RND transporter periplasmic adaptor subunit n=1 Tax=uncultured Methylibium sp. TaxID=381093 RepID=UPI0025FDB0D1|nr:efflux RND transporter periplasmic adaptor subunit [uncultured Methylibium sp.]
MNHHSIAPARGRRRPSGVALALTLLALPLALSLAACGGAQSGAAPSAAAAASEPKGKEEGGLKLSADEAQRAGIKLETLAEKAYADTVTVTATIRPNQDRIAQVAPRVEGRIVSVAATLGQEVRAGQVLAVLDSFALGEAHSALQRAQAAQRVAQADYQRAESLSAEEIIPQRELQRARAALETAGAELRAAADRLRLLGGTAAAGRHAESTFPVVAPLAGTVVMRKANIGELGSPAQPLFQVADLSTLWIEANLTEDKLARVRKGAAATVTVGAYPNERFAGRVTYVASMLDKDSRTTPARIEVPNKDGRLKPEMFASATIETGQARAPALSVPSGAVMLLQGQPTVFLAENGGYQPRPVETGEKSGGRTVVTSGLKAGDQVVAEGAYALKARLLKSQIGEGH